MTNRRSVVVTGTGAVCGAGMAPDAILDAVLAGRSAIAPITQWDTTGWPCRIAAEIADFNPRALVDDRKLHKLIRRTDLVGLYAAGRAIDALRHRRPSRRAGRPAPPPSYSDRTGVYVGSGGGNYENQYDFFPLFAAASGELPAFGRELANTVNPMWLLRTLPNNVLGHIGIKHGLKGPNACITNHSVGGTLAVIEAFEALRNGEADRAVAVGHETPIEPQMVLYYHRLGLLASETLRPFDARARRQPVRRRRRRAGARDRGVGGGAQARRCWARSWAAATPARRRACSRSATTATASRARSRQALDDAELAPADVGMIVAHGNGTPQSDVSEAAAIRRVFGAALPPVTGVQVGDRPPDRRGRHPRDGAGARGARARRGARHRDARASSIRPAPGCPCRPRAQAPRSKVALILCRGFAGTNAALVVRAA